MSKKVIEKEEVPTTFIEVYDNALPDDICDYLMATFNREQMMSYSSVYDSNKADECNGNTYTI